MLQFRAAETVQSNVKINILETPPPVTAVNTTFKGKKTHWIFFCVCKFDQAAYDA